MCAAWVLASTLGVQLVGGTEHALFAGAAFVPFRIADFDPEGHDAGALRDHVSDHRARRPQSIPMLPESLIVFALIGLALPARRICDWCLTNLLFSMRT